MVSKALLAEIKDRLAAAYGKRLRGVILYGSAARGEDTPESDIDIMALLDGSPTTWEDIHAATRAIYPIILRIGKIIDVAVVDIRRYEEGQAPLYEAARREGVVA